MRGFSENRVLFFGNQLACRKCWGVNGVLIFFKEHFTNAVFMSIAFVWFAIKQTFLNDRINTEKKPSSQIQQQQTKTETKKIPSLNSPQQTVPLAEQQSVKLFLPMKATFRKILRLKPLARIRVLNFPSVHPLSEKQKHTIKQTLQLPEKQKLPLKPLFHLPKKQKYRLLSNLQ